MRKYQHHRGINQDHATIMISTSWLMVAALKTSAWLNPPSFWDPAVNGGGGPGHVAPPVLRSLGLNPWGILTLSSGLQRLTVAHVRLHDALSFVIISAVDTPPRSCLPAILVFRSPDVEDHHGNSKVHFHEHHHCNDQTHRHHHDHYISIKLLMVMRLTQTTHNDHNLIVSMIMIQ